MIQILDHRDIREAEMFGVPDSDPAVCPFCDAEPEWFAVDDAFDIVGCDRCLGVLDAYGETCPVCGAKAKDYMVDKDDNIFGCDKCTHRSDVYAWFLDHVV